MIFTLWIFGKNAPYLTGQTNNIRVRLMTYSNAKVSAIRNEKEQFFYLFSFFHFQTSIYFWFLIIAKILLSFYQMVCLSSILESTLKVDAVPHRETSIPRNRLKIIKFTLKLNGCRRPDVASGTDWLAFPCSNICLAQTKWKAKPDPTLSLVRKNWKIDEHFFGKGYFFVLTF